MLIYLAVDSCKLQLEIDCQSECSNYQAGVAVQSDIL